MQVSEELVKKIWDQGARTRRYPKKTIKARIISKWRRTLEAAIKRAKQEAYAQGHRIIVLESKTRGQVQSFTSKDDEIFYTVDLADGICTCPWFMDFGHNEKPCKHQKFFAKVVSEEAHRAIEDARKNGTQPRKVINMADAMRKHGRMAHREAV